MLRFYPRAYLDRHLTEDLSQATDRSEVTVRGVVAYFRKNRTRNGREVADAALGVGAQRVALKWFHVHPGLEHRFRPGTTVVLSGKLERLGIGFQIVHPELHQDGSIHLDRTVPVYREIEGVSTRTLRTILWNALESTDLSKETLPSSVRSRRGLLTHAEALRFVHFPPQGTELAALLKVRTPAQTRLIYEEFFHFHEEILRRKQALTETQTGLKLASLLTERAIAEQAAKLPFQLTSGQRSALEEIVADFASGKPMVRLLQGDVGSGKTIVCLLATAAVVAQGYQTCLMAPTEILARQHFATAAKFLGKDFPAFLLTGSTPTDERRAILARLAAGEPLLLVGTHAVIQADVQYQKLALAMIDEQHRFGVEQRTILREKSPLWFPHLLTMSATPIPRTLALSLFGDLSISTIRERPASRKPSVTQVFQETGRAQAYALLREKLQSGEQAYVVLPLIEPSDADLFTSLRSVVDETVALRRGYLKGISIAPLHGRMSAAEKQTTMQAFQKGAIQVLVSTTVIEVGVDITNANVMLIEHADRFGLSQLHQLRGRVGRGERPGYCFLLASPPSETAERTESAEQRLKALETTDDGFELAELDLQMRGPGDFLGTRQSGEAPFRLADLIRDRELFELARADAVAEGPSRDGIRALSHESRLAASTTLD